MTTQIRYGNNLKRGYSRQKFYERALLLCTSLMKIQYEEDTCVGSKVSSTTLRLSSPSFSFNYKLRNEIWGILESGRIKNAYSIGCGPGNDALGLLAFLQIINGRRNKLETGLKTTSNSGQHNVHQDNIRHSSSSDDNTCVLLDRLVLMDWAIEEWNTVLDPFQSLLLKKKNLVSSIERCFCDVTLPCLHHSNTKAKQLISSPRSTNDNERNCDIFMISYLVSETREKWEFFFY